MPKPHDISDIDTSTDADDNRTVGSPLPIEHTPTQLIKPSRLEPIPALTDATTSSALAKPQTNAKSLYPDTSQIQNPDPPNLLALPTTDKTVSLLENPSSPTRARAASLSTLAVPAYIQAQQLKETDNKETTVALRPETGKKRKDRSKSVDSPRNSDDDLDTTFSERSPQHKKQDLTDRRDSIRVALVQKFQRLLDLQAQHTARLNSVKTKDNDRKVKELEEQLKQSKDEYNTLQNNLVKAEYAVTELAKEGLLLEATAEAAVKLAQSQSADLFAQLQTTEEEKTKLESQFKDIQKRLIDYYEFNLLQIKEAEKRNTEAFHKALQERDNNI